MTHPTNRRFRTKLFLPLLACTAVAWLFRDPIRAGVALLVAGTGLVTESADAAPHRGWFNGFDVSNATIPTSEILSGGPGRDGIPAIDKPKFLRPESAALFLRDDDRVISVTIGDETRAYPLRILVWHEIVNDEIAGQPVAVTYCPLCGTAMVFNRRIGDQILSFGVSGLLYQSDVLMYDRQTKSLWSQLATKAVSGPFVETSLEWLPSEHMTWKAWRERFPKGRVLSNVTGYVRDYQNPPYAGYEQNPNPMFPVPIHRAGLPAKSWVLGVVIDGTAVAYPLKSFALNHAVTNTIGGSTVVVSYDPQTQQARVVDANTGRLLPSVLSYWFAWQAFYPQTELWSLQ